MNAKEAMAQASPEFVKPTIQPTRKKSIWDLPIAAAVCVLASLLALGMVSRVYSDADSDKEQVFLDQKLRTLLLEVRAIAHSSVSVDDLHAWSDKGDLVPSLSFQKYNGDWLDPADPFSGNKVLGNQWLYARRLSIGMSPGKSQEALRLAKIELFRFEKNRGYVVVRESQQILGAGPTYEDAARVLDLYVLAIQNSPMAWGDPGSLRARFESRLLDLEARNPGIRIRTHWITKLAYGRDPFYRPGSPQDGEGRTADAYAYPRSYDLESLQDDGEDSLRCSLADSNNHALRLEEERRLFERRVRAGLENAEEPTWRLLLEDMHAFPERFRDAMIMNLHGGTLPLPPLRNSSDAAKIPGLDAGLRVVCHPEKLRFDDGRTGVHAEDVRLRVYAWRTEESEKVGTSDRPIVVRLFGMDLRPSSHSKDPGLSIEYLAGGKQANGRSIPYTPFESAEPWSGSKGDAGYEISYVPAKKTSKDPGEGYTEIRLHGTSTSCGREGEGGLDPSARLYGFEYIPLPLGAAADSSGDFSRDLSSTGVSPKNTARWRIRIPASLLRQELGERRALEICTSIGESDSSTPWNQSRTWTWWTSDLDAVPITERFQYMGDPRHNPYADLCDAGGSYPSGYNWYFDDFRSEGVDARRSWPSISKVGLADGWMGRIAVDLPRYFLLLREALRSSHAVFVQGPGPLAFAVSLGGEDGLQVPGHQVARQGPWWSKPWLGELFPDAYVAHWRERGNLPAGAFHTVPREDLRADLPEGTKFAAQTRRAGFEGGTSLMNSGKDWATFHHQRVSSQASVWTDDGIELIRRWSVEPGPRPTLPLPFRLRTSWHGAVGPEWPWQALYPRQRLELSRSFLTHERGALGLALVSARQPGQEGEARFLLNGLDSHLDLDLGVDLILSAALDSLLQGLDKSMDLLPLPRIERARFLSATQLQVDFDLSWPRSSEAQTVKRLEPLEERVRYRCLYSSDGGRTYRRLVDAAPATPDRPSRDPKEWIQDSRIGSESHQFEIKPASRSLEDGDWIIRIEAWLEGRKLHHAYHQQRIFNGS